MTAFDPEKIRLDFPILNKKRDSGRLVYLDNGATSQKPKQAIDAVTNFYENYNANVHRGISQITEDATTFYEQAREKVAKFINALPEEVVFTKGTTEGINFIADAWGRKNVNQNDQVLITEVEHHSNILPWQRLVKEKNALLKFVRLNKKTFILDTKNLDKLINKNTKLVSATHSSNVLGKVWESEEQLKRLIDKAHQVGAKVMLDSAQSAVHQKIDVKKLDVDFLAFSGHKMMGPTGIGVLYIKKELHDFVQPYQVGGSMVYSVFEHKDAIWNDPPGKFEAGTPPIAQAIGFGSAIDYINEKIDFEQLAKHEASLCNFLVDELQKIDGVKILGNIERMKTDSHLVSFYVDGVHVHDLNAYLNKKGVAVRSGHHCAQQLARILGVPSSMRVSFYAYNTMEDVHVFLQGLREGIKYFKG